MPPRLHKVDVETPTVRTESRVYEPEEFGFRFSHDPGTKLFRITAHRTAEGLEKQDVGKIDGQVHGDTLRINTCNIVPRFQMRGLGVSLYRVLKKVLGELEGYGAGKKLPFKRIIFSDVVNPYMRERLRRLKDRMGRKKYKERVTIVRGYPVVDFLRDAEPEDFPEEAELKITTLEEQIAAYLESLLKFSASAGKNPPFKKQIPEMVELVLRGPGYKKLKKFLPAHYSTKDAGEDDQFKKQQYNKQTVLRMLGENLFKALSGETPDDTYPIAAFVY